MSLFRSVLTMVVVVLFISAANLWAGGQKEASAATSANSPIRVGVSAPLTGQFAQDGVWMKQGVNLAVKEINAAGGIKGHPIQLFYGDDQGPNPTMAANAVTKLITQDHVVAMIGPHFTPGMVPSEPILAEHQVPALTGATGPAVTAQGNKWVFRVRLDDFTGAQVLVKYLVEDLHWKKIGLDYVNTAFGQSGIHAVEAALKSYNIQPALTETHQDSTKDFTSQLLAFQQAGVQGIIVWTDDQPGGLIGKQMQTLGVHFKLAGSTTFSQPPFLRLAGSAANGAISVTDYIQSNPAPAMQAWAKKFSAVYGHDPELYSTTYFDATHILAWALNHATSFTGPAIQQALTKLDHFKGIMDTYTYSSNGDLAHAGLITQVANDKPKIVEQVTQKGY